MTFGRIVLIVLTLWGLAMIIPDLLRAVQPVGSFGVLIDNDGLVYDVKEPFTEEANSPAYRAGLRVGDQLDLEAMRCWPDTTVKCRNALSALGGLQFVLPGQSVDLIVAAKDNQPEHTIKVTAAPRPSNALIRIVILLDQIAGILVVLAAAWLVWARPSAMSWGFFLYANWFNPGQSYDFYAILQQWPAAILTQDLLGCFAQGAGYAGFLLFVLRAPRNETEPRWRTLERALPAIGVLISLLLAASYGSVFGYRSETLTRAGVLVGLVVAFAAVAILFARRSSQRPEDYQRLRWVLWGCLIGLPAFTIAELASWTTFFETPWGDFTPSDDIIGLLYLVNGVLCLFVFEAIRRPRVVSVNIPLRRVTILGLTLSLPVLLLHEEVERLHGHLDLPGWAWLALGAVLVFIITRVHEGVVRLADRYFNRHLDEVERDLGQAIVQAKAPEEVDLLLTAEPFQRLKLTSAAAFRLADGVFSRCKGAAGWEDCATRCLKADSQLIDKSAGDAPFGIPEKDTIVALPHGIARPVLGVPAANPVRCYAISLYGPHATGTDLDANERGMLARLASRAAAAYAELENRALKAKLAELENSRQGVPSPGPGAVSA